MGAALAWTFIEYKEHRFTLHQEVYLDLDGPNDGEHLAKIFSRHLHHHVFMNQAKRIVQDIETYVRYMTPPTAVLAFVLPHHIAFTFVAGVLTGSLIYDGMHFAFHHGPDLKFGWFQYMKAQHMRHHFRDNLVEFGVTVDLWDYVFGTKPLASKYD